MVWQGANQEVQAPSESGETVEAALNRLSKAYSAAMECMGAMALDASLAETAKQTFETALLSDPLIRIYTPYTRKWLPAAKRPAPVMTSQQSTLQRLAYLSLVNYAELVDDPATIVGLLLDAVALDAKDVTVWWKLAHAAPPSRLKSWALEQTSSTRRGRKAWKEYQQSPGLPHRMTIDETLPTVTVHLSQSTWTALGKLVLDLPDGVRVKVTMSPLLKIPFTTLQHIASFLDASTPLEATCRALRGLRRPKKRSPKKGGVMPLPPPTRQESERSDDRRSPARSSKRLQTQLITSGKRAERSSRRSSVEYCLIAAAFGMKRDDPRYQSMCKFPVEMEPTLDKRRQEVARGDLSLSQFLVTWDSALELAIRMVAHLAIHVQGVSPSFLECMEILVRRTASLHDVVWSWYLGTLRIPRGVVVSDVQRIAMDVLHGELRFRRCEEQENACAAFDGDANFLSLLIRQLVVAVERLDSDQMDAEDSDWIRVKARLYWLATRFFLWRRNLCGVVDESIYAEKEGLRYLHLCEGCLALPSNSPVGRVATPHLASQDRSSMHWKELTKETLGAYRAEVLASSIVLKAQEEFIAVQLQMGSLAPDEISEGIRQSLLRVARTLVDRYHEEDEGPHRDKMSELIGNFLSVHGEGLISSDEGLDMVLPLQPLSHATLLTVSSPSILDLVSICSAYDSSLRPSVAALYSRLVSAVCEMHNSHVQFLESTYDDRQDDEESVGSLESDRMSANAVGKIETSLQRQYARLVCLLLDKLSLMFADCQFEKPLADFCDSGLFRDMVHSTFELIKGWAYRHGLRLDCFASDQEDLAVLRSLIRLMDVVGMSSRDDTSGRLTLLVGGMMETVLIQQRILVSYLDNATVQYGRAERHKLSRYRCDVVAILFMEMGRLASMFPSIQDKLNLRRSLMHEGIAYESSYCECILWFRRLVHPDVPALVDFDPVVSFPEFPDDLKLDRSNRERLRLPVAVALVGVAASLGTTDSPQAPAAGIVGVALSDLIDSDASASGWISDDDDEDEGSPKRLFRTLSHCVYTIKNAVDPVYEVPGMVTSTYVEYDTSCGPLLPLVVCRILHRLADVLLTGFNEDPIPTDAEWKDYSRGTRSLGIMLDSILHRSYRFLYGFTMSDIRDSKDSGASAASEPTSGTWWSPENSNTLVQLYKCMMRSYGHGRKIPSKAILSFILTNLPPLDEDDRCRSLKAFLFSSKSTSPTAELVSLVCKEPGWERRFGGIHDTIFDDIDNAQSPKSSDLSIVRRGISALYADGPLPAYQDGSASADFNARDASQQTEEELSTKFLSLVDTLAYGDPQDTKAWFKASQCASMKADLIADRIGLSRGFVRSQKLMPQTGGRPHDRRMILTRLLEHQDSLDSSYMQTWTPYIGSDLSYCVECCWSSLEMLSRYSDAVGEQLLSTENSPFEDASLEFVQWHEVQRLRDKEDRCAWQHAWGGLFVSALRLISQRCLSIALYIRYSLDSDLQKPLEVLELSEAISISLYSELMGAQLYGYPLQALPQRRKRVLGEAALACFNRTEELFRLGNVQEGGDQSESWDTAFMIGKCHEKVASTFAMETYNASDPLYRRMYERRMRLSLDSYALSLDGAKVIEKSGGLTTERKGGSSHGVAEIVYRLHASRLKCIISALEVPVDERELAEREALRLAESHWFNKTDGNSSETQTTIRGRLWTALADIVSAMVWCRNEHVFFHRSVYRHAQALMWAPVLHDPIGCRALGALETVPPTWACKIRGLNHATNAACSGLSVLQVLFDKRRPQICAVWITTSSYVSSLNTINNSIRKYDSLRGKYISAYIDALTLCGKQLETETLWRSILSCSRDLPSFFAASAVSGAKVQKSHTQDSLLLKGRSLVPWYVLASAKRRTNAALASITLDSMKTTTGNDELFWESKLKEAYGCLIRLNCRLDDLTKERAWHFYRFHPDFQPILEAVLLAYTKGGFHEQKGPQSLLSIFRTAIYKCRKLFPTMKGTVQMKRATKRKAPPSEAPKDTPKTFEVPVPDGLAAGDTFVAAVKVGPATKKIRLTIPDGQPKSLRFSLGVTRD